MAIPRMIPLIAIMLFAIAFDSCLGAGNDTAAAGNATGGGGTTPGGTTTLDPLAAKEQAAQADSAKALADFKASSDKAAKAKTAAETAAAVQDEANKKAADSGTKAVEKANEVAKLAQARADETRKQVAELSAKVNASQGGAGGGPQVPQAANLPAGSAATWVICAKSAGGDAKPQTEFLKDASGKPVTAIGKWADHKCGYGAVPSFAVEGNDFGSYRSQCVTQGFQEAQPIDGLHPWWYPFEVNGAVANYFRMTAWDKFALSTNTECGAG